MTEEIIVSIRPGSVPPIAHVSQFDTKRDFSISFSDGVSIITEALGDKAILEATKADGTIVMHDINYNASRCVASFSLKDIPDLTTAAGDAWCKVRVIDSSSKITIASGAFVLAVDMAGVKQNAVMSKADVQTLEELLLYGGDAAAASKSAKETLEEIKKYSLDVDTVKDALAQMQTIQAQIEKDRKSIEYTKETVDSSVQEAKDAAKEASDSAKNASNAVDTAIKNATKSATDSATASAKNAEKYAEYASEYANNAKAAVDGAAQSAAKLATEDAKNSAEAAAKSAESAEKSATEATNAAASAVNDSKNWAVGPSSERTEGTDISNAQYYARQALSYAKRAEEAYKKISQQTE